MLCLFIIAFLSWVEPADYLALVPDRLVPDLAPLVEWRRSKGLSVRVVPLTARWAETLETSAPHALLGRVKKEYFLGKKRLRFLLLVGDAEEEGIPSFVLDHYRWMESDAETLVSDTPYGDMEGDLLPEIAVGRLPVHSGTQLKQVIQKIIRFESKPKKPSQRLQVLLFAGSSGYTPAVDRFLEAFSRTMLDAHLPLHYSLRVVYANLASPYCPPPDGLGSAFVESLDLEPAYSVFMGHGSKRTCYGMTWEKGKTRLLCGIDPDHLSRLKRDVSSGPLFFFSCDTGFFDGEEPCMAEEILLCPGGPVSVIASSRYSHPLPNLYTTQALLESLAEYETVGELITKIKSRGLNQTNPLVDMLLKDAEGSLEESINVQRLKEDQVWLYNLLGDPATSIKGPLPLEMEGQFNPSHGGIHLKVKSPLEKGEGFAALYHARTWEPPKKPLPDLEASEEAWRSAKKALFEEVNQKEILRFPLNSVGPHWEKQLSFDEKLPPGKYRLAVYLQALGKDAAGAITLMLKAQ